jgi:hypothetical protein
MLIVSPAIRAKSRFALSISLTALKYRPDGSLVEVLDVKQLMDPFAACLSGRFHAGEEMQEPQSFTKTDLVFPSDEAMPRCWLDPAYHQG